MQHCRDFRLSTVIQTCRLLHATYCLFFDVSSSFRSYKLLFLTTRGFAIRILHVSTSVTGEKKVYTDQGYTYLLQYKLHHDGTDSLSPICHSPQLCLLLGCKTQHITFCTALFKALLTGRAQE